MNLSRTPVSAQQRGYDDTTSCISEFPGTAVHRRDSECVWLGAEQGGGNANTEIKIFNWNGSIPSSMVAERLYHHFARDSV